MLQQMRYFIIAIVIFRRFHCVASCRMLHFDIYNLSSLFLFLFLFFASDWAVFLHLDERAAIVVQVWNEEIVAAAT